MGVLLGIAAGATAEPPDPTRFAAQALALRTAAIEGTDAATTILATKADIKHVEEKIAGVERETATIAQKTAGIEQQTLQLHGAMADSKIDIIKWNFGTMLAFATLLIAAIKLF